MTADPWIVLMGHLHALAIGGRPAFNQTRRERIKDATTAAREMFTPHSARDETLHETMVLAVADLIAWHKWKDDHLRLLIAAVAIERDNRAELKHINRMVEVANSPRHMKGARG